MSSNTAMNKFLSKKTTLLSLRIWVIIGIAVGSSIVSILCILYIYAAFRKKSRSISNTKPVDRIRVQKVEGELILTLPAANPATKKSSEADTISQCSSMNRIGLSSDGSSGRSRIISSSPMEALPEISHLGWGHWFTLRDLQVATNRFAAANVIGGGGYGVVYRGKLVNGVEVAVKKIINNLGQAEREFRLEVEAIGHVRHKNLVKLLGFCIEGVHRMLVYEYVNNGNLEQWLHLHRGALPWEDRMKIILGTSKALAYLHEAIEPKVIHRDIKSSNILIDHDFNPKVSDFGLAKLLDSRESHVTTRVMGTFGYVAPEYANTGFLNEKSDVYSFGILLLEAITGRDPVDYSRKEHEVNLVEWIKLMIASKRFEEVVDRNLERTPEIRCLKTALLVAVRCIDSDAMKRPRMSQVVRMLEPDERPFSEIRRNMKNRNSVEIDSKKDDDGGIDPSAE